MKIITHRGNSKAIEDLQKIKKKKSIFSTKRATNQNNLNIPINTLN